MILVNLILFRSEFCFMTCSYFVTFLCESWSKLETFSSYLYIYSWWLKILGASSGIGSETARVLALRGANVIMGVRNMVAGKKVKEEIVKEIPAAKVDIMELDLSSLASVRKFASEFTSSGRPLNLLMWVNNSLYSVKYAFDLCRVHIFVVHPFLLCRIFKSAFRLLFWSNNAGMASPFELSEDNIELHFATNHLGIWLFPHLYIRGPFWCNFLKCQKLFLVLKSWFIHVW